MGGGPKRTYDRRKPLPVSVIDALDPRQANGALAVGPGDGASPCAQPVAVPFTADAETEVREGAGVRIVIGDPPYVMDGRDLVGQLEGARADVVRACLEEGYRFSGCVKTYDADACIGVVHIRGRRDDRP